MKATIQVILTLAMIAAPAVSQAKEGPCDVYMDKLERGINMTVKVIGRSIFDPDVVKPKVMNVTVKPFIVRDSCQSENQLSFEVKKDFTLEYENTRYVGVFNPERHGAISVIVHQDRLAFAPNTMAAVFHAVVADLAKKMEFDSFEAPSASPYIPIFDIGAGPLPFSSNRSILFGIAGKYGHLFQFFAENYQAEIIH